MTKDLRWFGSFKALKINLIRYYTVYSIVLYSVNGGVVKR